MTVLDFNFGQMHANAFSRTAEIVPPEHASEIVSFVPERVVTSDPVTELLEPDDSAKMTEVSREIPVADNQWTHKQELRFSRLAEREALGKLTTDELIELDRLSQQRRSLKNPRSGEELLWEYEQRKLTRGLVEALTKYVNFHQAPRNP